MASPFKGRPSVHHPKRRRILWLAPPSVIHPSCADVGVPQPLLHLCNVRVVLQRTGGCCCAQSMRPHVLPGEAQLLHVAHHHFRVHHHLVSVPSPWLCLSSHSRPVGCETDETINHPHQRPTASQFTIDLHIFLQSFATSGLSIPKSSKIRLISQALERGGNLQREDGPAKPRPRQSGATNRCLMIRDLFSVTVPGPISDDPLCVHSHAQPQI